MLNFLPLSTARAFSLFVMYLFFSLHASLGVNWSQVYKKKFGPAKKYLESRKDTFVITGTFVRLTDAAFVAIMEDTIRSNDLFEEATAISSDGETTRYYPY